MNPAEARRYARHVALPEIGPEGQERFLRATVLLVLARHGEPQGASLALETAALYLGFAGVTRFAVVADGPDANGATPAALRLVEALRQALPQAHFTLVPRPLTGTAWQIALGGISVGVRADFEDDAFVLACRDLGMPAVVARAPSRDSDTPLDLLSLRPAGPSGAQAPSVPPPSVSSPDTPDQSGAVLAGTLAAAEALWVLAGRPPGDEAATATGVMRHLRLPLAPFNAPPVTQNIPWPPNPPTEPA
ncbi:MAG: hypothetical protein KA712_22310 [Myxococcales bacterium]|nr:hypothetical protein [Myxococcales bacterium]